MSGYHTRSQRSWPHDGGDAAPQYRAQLSTYALLIILLLLSGCQRNPARIEGVAMTIGYIVQIGDPNPDLARAEEIINQTFSEIDQIYNNWNPLSEISILNALPAREIRQLSPPLAAFLRRIDAIVRLTQGRFDPTIAPVKKSLLTGQLEADTEPLGWDKIHLEGSLFWKESGGTTLDLGGVAKGYAVDLILERLREAGFNHLFVEWGGEIRTTGRHPQGRPWKIAIRGGETLELTEKAIATSGSYLQKWTIEGAEYTHIIDPTTKKPLSNGAITSASVVCETCFEADAVATALMLFPSKEEAYAWAEKNHFKILLF